MTIFQIDEFVQEYKFIIEKIQKGESILLMLNNKPLAELLPVANRKKKWKRYINPIRLSNNISITQFIREERDAK